MDPWFKGYIAFWATVCALGTILFLRHPGDCVVSQRRYWLFLAEPWKLAAFAAGTALITLVAPYTGDPTWDHADGFFMSLLCFGTAPWVVGVLYGKAQGRTTWSETYVAVCAWLFSASWSYDIYLVWRDGRYPETWLANLFASSLIYLAAGLFWNLEWVRGRGVIFSFMREGWPSRPAESAPLRLLGYGLILALPAIAAVVVFLL